MPFRYPCYAILIVNAFLLVHLMLSQDALWDNNMSYRTHWLTMFFVYLALVIVVSAYAIYAAIRRWLHGPQLYGGLIALILLDSLFGSRAFVVMAVLSLACTEVLTGLFILADGDVTWRRQFARAHYVILCGFGVSGLVAIMMARRIWSSPLDGAAMLFLVFCGFNLLNLVLARVVGGERGLWGYAVGIAESIVVVLGLLWLSAMSAMA